MERTLGTKGTTPHTRAQKAIPEYGELSWVPSGPCRTEFRDVGFDFIVVGTNSI